MSEGSTNSAGEFLELTIPVTISVRIGGPTHAGAAPAIAVESDSVRPEEDYGSRPGFDANFLGVRLSLPKPQNTIFRDVAALADGSYELKYHHYSVVMNKKRRLAFVSAVNLDADAPFRHERKGKDRWYLDPRMDEELQAANEFYSANPLDRGHLTRRADAAWGYSEEDAKRANDDTFHWTNCAPQHEIYNQSTLADQRGLLLWGSIENHIAQQAKNGLKKLSVFNGPIFRDRGSNKDPDHRGLLVPREFWKVIAYPGSDGELKAVAFILSQESLLEDLPAEDFVVGPYAPFQVKVTEIERKTKLDFGDLYKSDALERTGAEESFATGTEFVKLTSLAQVVL